MDARAFKILKALLGCGRSPDKVETTGPNQKQTKSEADNNVRCCHPRRRCHGKHDEQDQTYYSRR
jgi:hypothetical protein